MKSIVCFGDSNTWGYIPGSGGRFSWNSRWTGRLQGILGESARVIEEGLSGRTTCLDDPLSIGKNGLAALPIILQTHSPIDLIVIMLGTNDMKTRFNSPAFAIAQGALSLLKACLAFDPRPNEILLVSPALVVETKHKENSYGFEGALEKSLQLAEHYEYFAKQTDSHFYNAAKSVVSSRLDGIHWDEEQHSKFAKDISSVCKTILNLS